MTTQPTTKPKIFLAYEIGGIRADVLREAFDIVFPDTAWTKSYGLLPQVGPEAPKTHEQIHQAMKDGCAVFDLTGEKRQINNGLNLNVLFELGLGLGLGIPTFAIAYQPVVTYREIHDRASDLDGCGIYGYASRESLLGLLESARHYFLSRLGMPPSQEEPKA